MSESPPQSPSSLQEKQHSDLSDRFVHLSPDSLIDHEKRTVVQLALAVIGQEQAKGETINSPDDAETYLHLKLAQKKREVFAVLFLNTKHQVIAYEELFKGTINSSEVHPRIVVQRALEHNAGAVIFAHNHPSSSTKPSQADQDITARLISLLDLVDIKVLDHFIIGKKECLSFARNGLLG